MSHIGPEILAGPEEDNVGSRFDDRVSLEEAHCVQALVEPRLRHNEGPAASVARVHPTEELRSVVLAITLNATGDEVKNSLIGCVAGVSVAGSSIQGGRLCPTVTEPTDTLLEVKGFTLTTLSHCDT